METFTRATCNFSVSYHHPPSLPRWRTRTARTFSASSKLLHTHTSLIFEFRFQSPCVLPQICLLACAPLLTEARAALVRVRCAVFSLITLHKLMLPRPPAAQAHYLVPPIPDRMFRRTRRSRARQRAPRAVSSIAFLSRISSALAGRSNASTGEAVPSTSESAARPDMAAERARSYPTKVSEITSIPTLTAAKYPSGTEMHLPCSTPSKNETLMTTNRYTSTITPTRVEHTLHSANPLAIASTPSRDANTYCPTRPDAGTCNVPASISASVDDSRTMASEVELWGKACEWVQKQVLVTFRHRAILSRLAPVIDGVARIDLTDSMLNIQLPSGRTELQTSQDRVHARQLRSATSSAASTSPLRNGEMRGFVPSFIARSPSKTSIELMTDAVRARIRSIDYVPARPHAQRLHLDRKHILAIQQPSLGSRLSRTPDSTPDSLPAASTMPGLTLSASHCGALNFAPLAGLSVPPSPFTVSDAVASIE
eukprot:IDg7712t1